MEGIFPAPAPSPVVLGTLTLEMAAVAIRISPREDKFLPWIILKSLSAVASTRAEISNSIDFLAAARLR